MQRRALIAAVQRKLLRLVDQTAPSKVDDYRDSRARQDRVQKRI